MIIQPYSMEEKYLIEDIEDEDVKAFEEYLLNKHKNKNE